MPGHRAADGRRLRARRTALYSLSYLLALKPHLAGDSCHPNYSAAHAVRTLPADTNTHIFLPWMDVAFAHPVGDDGAYDVADARDMPPNLRCAHRLLLPLPLPVLRRAAYTTVVVEDKLSDNDAAVRLVVGTWRTAFHPTMTGAITVPCH